MDALARVLFLTASVAVTTGIVLTAAAARAQELRPGDARFDAVLRRLIHEGSRRIPNEPACVTTARDARKAQRFVTIGDALAGAVRRESESGRPLRFSLRCHRAGESATTEECRLVVSAASDDQESSAGFSFEAPVGSAKIAMSTVRCTITP